MQNEGYEKDLSSFEEYIKVLNNHNIIKDSITVADIGCASGKFLSMLNPTIKKYGFDYSEDYVKTCRNNHQDISFEKLNMECDSIHNKEFDLIVMFDSIEHFRNYLNLANLVDNNLKKNGFLVITTPNANSILKYINKSNFTGELDQSHVALFTAYTLEFMLRRMGLKKVFCYTPFSFLKLDNKLNKILPMGGQIFCAFVKF